VSEHVIVHRDNYQIFDRLADYKRKHPKLGPLGWVEVFLNSKKVHKGPNLVSSLGREFVAQKIFDAIGFEGGSRPDLRGHILSHFAVGSGGASVGAGNTVTLLGPYICDLHLNEPIQLGNTAYLDEPSNYDAGDGIHVFTDSVKAITTDGEVVLESEDYSGDVDCTNYTKVKCVCKVPAGEPSGILSGESVQISEAGLYLVNGTDVKLFSHICFPPKWKEKESDLTINWYILC
jgi:hypothetical protein